MSLPFSTEAGYVLGRAENCKDSLQNKVVVFLVHLIILDENKQSIVYVYVLVQASVK